MLDEDSMPRMWSYLLQPLMPLLLLHEVQDLYAEGMVPATDAAC